MSNIAKNCVNIIGQFRVTNYSMNSFFHGVVELMAGAAKTTGVQASAVRGELTCRRPRSDSGTSRTRDCTVTDYRTHMIPVSSPNRNVSKTTGPAASAGNRGELYGGFHLV